MRCSAQNHGVCSEDSELAGWAMSGWTWAAVEDVVELFSIVTNGLFDGTTGTLQAADAEWGPAFFDDDDGFRFNPILSSYTSPAAWRGSAGNLDLEALSPRESLRSAKLEASQLPQSEESQQCRREKCQRSRLRHARGDDGPFEAVASKNQPGSNSNAGESVIDLVSPRLNRNKARGEHAQDEAKVLTRLQVHARQIRGGDLGKGETVLRPKRPKAQGAAE